MSAPVKNTCPDIDKLIRKINSALKETYAGMDRHEKRSEEWYAYNGIEGELYDAESILEALRKDNEALRDWGRSLEEELHAAAQQIDDLEDQLKTASLNTSDTP